MTPEAMLTHLEDPHLSAEEAELIMQHSPQLSDAETLQWIKHLEAVAESYWYKDAHSALIIADRMIRIGELRADPSLTGWGRLSRANGFLVLGQDSEAWNEYQHSGELFLSAGEQVGWARTRSGALALSVNLGRVTEALEEAETARKILQEHSENERLLRLELNNALVYNQLGEYQKALPLFEAALNTAQALGESADPRLATLFCNKSYAHLYLGGFEEARVCITKAHHHYRKRHEIEAAHRVEINLAYIDQAQGNYRQALQQLYVLRDFFQEENLLVLSAQTKREIVECYLHLNRYEMARDLAEETISQFRDLGDHYEMAQVLVQLATAQAELSAFEDAHLALNEAESLFISQQARSWQASIPLKRGQIALRQGDFVTAHCDALTAAQYFQESTERVNYAKAVVLDAEALLAGSANRESDISRKNGRIALQIAQECSLPALQYEAYRLLGRVAEADSRVQRAIRYYRAASLTLDRVQQQLTITLRPGFLEDKVEALHALIRLYLAQGQVSQALDTLEWAKSQTYLGYVLNQDNLRWLENATDGDQELLQELHLLRSQHQWFYELAYGQSPPEDESGNRVKIEQIQPEFRAREHRIREITERLHLQHNSVSAAARKSISQIQKALDTNAVLIEFYNDTDKLWAFVLNSTEHYVYQLPIGVDALNDLINALEFNFNMALASNISSAEMVGRLIEDAQEQLMGLYTALIKPLEEHFCDQKRLIFVPYGAIHYLPLNLLYDGNAYLIEKHELVILPSAALITQPNPQRPQAEALVLAHSHDGKLPKTKEEADLVKSRFGGAVFYDEEATRDVLQSSPRQLLHIAAHGEHRIDQPDLSYIQLADGQLWVDDVLQLDLSYELITLSACETGRNRITNWDEGIGIGRGFLIAGAGALLVSLWRVPDAATYHFMDQFYDALYQGYAKATALQMAQCHFIRNQYQSHPATWGAFQLIGNAEPLSSSGKPSANDSNVTYSDNADDKGKTSL